MSLQLERFLAGEDAVARLIRQVPAFEPSSDMQSAFLENARIAQSEHDATALRFEPPATLQANVLAEAARLQAAQADRRDALLAQLRTGKHMDEVLGAPISAETNAWLQAQATAAAPTAALSPKRRASWWPQIGAIATAAIVGGVATQWLQEDRSARWESSAIQEQVRETPAPLAAAEKETPLPLADKVAKPSSPPRRDAAQADAPPSIEHGSAATSTVAKQARHPAAEAIAREKAADRSANSAGPTVAAPQGNGLALRAPTSPAPSPTIERERLAEQAAAADSQARIASAAPAAATQKQASVAPSETTMLVELQDSPTRWTAQLHDNAARKLRISVADPHSKEVVQWLAQLKKVGIPQSIDEPEQADDVPAGKARLQLLP